MVSSTNDELVYAQEQEQNQTDFLDKKSNQEMNLTLGNPIYIEIFTVPKSQNKT